MAKLGQPTLYREEVCDELFEYFDRDPYESVDGVDRPCDFPTFAGFARKIGRHRSTLNDWTRKYVEFADAWAIAKECQEHILVTNGLRGLYNASFAIFTAKNVCGYRDKQPGEDEKPPVPPPQLTPEQFNEYVERMIAARRAK